MKPLRLFAFIVLYLSFIICHAQSGTWTWMKGDTNSLINYVPPVYGTMGVPGQLNNPLMYYENNRWTDKNGNFWLMSDNDHMCMFSPSTNEWNWESGDGNWQPSYGTQGVSSPTNTPGNRWLACPNWTDTAGNFWLFAGYNVDSDYIFNGQVMADLWKYDITIHQWAWMSGSNVGYDVGRYGVQGIPSINNYPCGRGETTVTWVDSATNTLWMFGGQSWTDSMLNDLWKYNIATNEWTWMKGDSIGSGEVSPVYGTLRQPGPANTPGHRAAYSSWKDRSGNFWMFGGYDFDNYVGYNDMWMYNPSTNMWTWMSGLQGEASFNEPTGNCVYDSLFVPMPVTENKSAWTDPCGHFWMMDMILNVMWQYDPVINQWKLPKGDAAGNHQLQGRPGIRGVPDTANWPYLVNGASTWTDRSGNLWLSTYTDGNLLWKYTPDSSCTGACSVAAVCNASPPAITANTDIFCSGDSALVCASSGYSSYQWNSGATGTGSCIYAKRAGDYYVQVTDGNNCSAQSNHIFISVYPVPSVAIVVQGDTLSSFGQVSYQWLLYGVPVNGATGPVYVAKEQGSYTVQVTDTNGCTTISEPVVLTGIPGLSANENFVNIYPNPSVNGWQLTVANELVGSVLEVFDDEGRTAWKGEIRTTKYELTAGTLAKGVYYLRISNAEGSVVRKLVKL